MKIGIMTFWAWDENYGSQLQCYALQRILVLLGHDPFLIRYVPSRVGVERPSLIRRVVRKIRRVCTGRFVPWEEERRLRAFDAFQDEHLRMSSKKYFSLDELRRDCPIADLYMVGSDQVWNCNTTSEEGKVWFLDFAPPGRRLVSYAAGIGSRHAGLRYRRFMAPLLRRFSAVSVREMAGVGICQNAGFENVVRVCDPTLLLPAAAWRSLCRRHSSVSCNILVYALDVQSVRDVAWHQICRMASNENLSVKVVPVGDSRFLFPEDLLTFPTVEAFLALIDKAEYILTNSYHGMLFSIQFHKSFIVFPRRNGCGDTNNRMMEVLDVLGLKQRMFDPGVDLSRMLHDDIDWDDVDSRLSSFKDISNEFLRKSLV